MFAAPRLGDAKLSVAAGLSNTPLGLQVEYVMAHMRIPVSRLLAFVDDIRRFIPQDYRPLLRDSVVYGLSIALSRSFGIILTPILTRIFAPSEYGVIDTIVVTTALLLPFMSINLESALVRYYYETRPGQDRRRFVSTVIGAVLALSLLVVGTCSLGIQWLGQILFQNPAHDAAILISLWASAFQLLGAMFLWILRLERRMRGFLMCTALLVVSNFSLTLLFVVMMKVGVTGFFVAMLISSLAQCGLAFWILRHSFDFTFSVAVLKRCIRFSLPLVLTVFIPSLLTFSSRYLLLSFSGLTQVGLLAIASKMSALALFIFAPFQMAWQPFSMSVMHRPDAKIIYANVTRYVVLGLGLILYGIVFFAPEIVALIAGPAYREASSILRFLITGIVAGQLVVFFHLSISIAERPVLLLYSNLISMAVFLMSGVILTPLFGGIGVALAFVCSGITRSGSVYLFAQRESRIEYPIRRIGLTILLSLGLGVCLQLVEIPWPVRLLALIVISVSVVILFTVEARARGFLSNPRSQQDFTL